MAAFLKIGDIKGEFASNVSVEAFGTGSAGCQTMPPSEIKTDGDDAGFKIDALTNGDTYDGGGGTYDGGGGTYDGGGGQYVSSYSEDGANSFTTGGGGDSLTDAGLGNNSFHQGADVLTNVSYTTDRNGVWDDPTTWSGASASVISEACTPTCPTGFAEDALVQQASAPSINATDASHIGEFSVAIRVTDTAFTLHGSAVDSWTEKTFGNGDGEILGGISQGNVFAPINVLRNGYNCEDFGACSG